MKTLQQLIPKTFGNNQSLLNSVIKTKYAKKTINSMLLMLLATVVRLHIDAALSMIVRTNVTYLDFWIQIGLSVLLVIKSGWIYWVVKKFDEDCYAVTRYALNNYTDENYRQWKRNTIMIGSAYLFIYFSIVEINSSMIRLQILQYVICYMIVDFLQSRRYAKLINFFDYDSVPGQSFNYQDDNFELQKNNVDQTKCNMEKEPEQNKNSKVIETASTVPAVAEKDIPEQTLPIHGYISGDNFNLKMGPKLHGLKL